MGLKHSDTVPSRCLLWLSVVVSSSLQVVCNVEGTYQPCLWVPVALAQPSSVGCFIATCSCLCGSFLWHPPHAHILHLPYHTNTTHTHFAHCLSVLSVNPVCQSCLSLRLSTSPCVVSPCDSCCQRGADVSKCQLVRPPNRNVSWCSIRHETGLTFTLLFSLLHHSFQNNCKLFFYLIFKNSSTTCQGPCEKMCSNKTSQKTETK